MLDRGRNGITRRAVALALLIGGLLAAGAAPAAAQQGSADLWVTIAARECDEYTDIRANRARNNIMESLQDLGEDSLYEPGQQVDPRTELAGQPSCRPITGWRFTFGSGILGRAVSGPWGSLSIVTDPDSTGIVTRESIPLRDFQAHPVPGVRLPGAVTIGLNRDQADRSGQNTLWIQGGTPDDPVLFADPAFADRYGFGALRCALDGLNGDNVETIQFPVGARHVFCYAYYVTPPPSSGTIVIRKEVAGASEDATSFRFAGNLSFNEGGGFELQAAAGAPGSTSFYRAETRPGDAPWTVIEDVPPGWTLTGIECESAASTAATDVAAGRVEITLAAGDTVTCTYTNRLTPPAGALLIAKVTERGAGTFRYRVTDADGDVVARPRATTTRAGVPALALPGPLALDPGRYRIAERSPATGAGEWRLRRVVCNGSEQPAGEPASVEVTAGRGAVCVFRNRLARPGRIAISKVTRGGTGTAAFVVSPLGDPEVQRRKTATTREPGTPVRARGESTRGLPFGRYVIQESAADPDEAGRWALASVVCNGALMPFEQGRIVVRVTRRQPIVRCRFLNQRLPEPSPEPPPGPDPVPGEGEGDVVLDKVLVGAGATSILTFRLTVSNRADVAATEAVLTDRLARGTVLVSARPSQGRCVAREPLVCTLGRIEGGGRATVTVQVQRVAAVPGVNVAVVGTGSPDARAANNADRVRVRGLSRRGTACPAALPRARAAC